MNKVNTAQLDNKLFIMNGVDPIRYVDLTTNKVKQYEPKRDWYGKFLKKFKRQRFESTLYYPVTDGYKVTAAYPNIMNILTVKPKRRFDGQVFFYG